MAGQPYTTIGRLGKSHGLRGEIALVLYGPSAADDLRGIALRAVPPSVQVRSTSISAARETGKGLLVTLAGVDCVDTARQLTGRELLAKTDDLPSDWFADDVPDVIGVAVTDARRGYLGSIDEVIETGANDVWVVHGPLGEVLIPVIEDVVVSVDLESRDARVELLPGLVDAEAEEQ